MGRECAKVYLIHLFKSNARLITRDFHISGDSGGGIIFKRILDDGAEVYYIKGIVSNGKYVKDKEIVQCDNFYTLFTNVLEYIPFIKETVEEYP